MNPHADEEEDAAAPRRDKVRAALFSGAGSPPLGRLVEAARALIRPGQATSVAYLPAASTTRTFVELTTAAFDGTAAVETVGVDSSWMPDQRDAERLRRADLIYVSGGNTYLLAHRLRRSGLYDLVRERVLGGVPLLAFSAGTVLCGPTIVSSNDWNVVESTRFDGLGILPFHVTVHYPVNPEAVAERDERIHHFLAIRRESVVALEEEAWLSVHGSVVVPRDGRAWLLTAEPETKHELPIGEPIPPLVLEPRTARRDQAGPPSASA